MYALVMGASSDLGSHSISEKFLNFSSPLKKVIFICFFKGAPFLELELFWKRKITFKRKSFHFYGMALPDLSAFNVHKTRQNKTKTEKTPSKAGFSTSSVFTRNGLDAEEAHLTSHSLT